MVIEKSKKCCRSFVDQLINRINKDMIQIVEINIRLSRHRNFFKDVTLRYPRKLSMVYPLSELEFELFNTWYNKHKVK